MVAEDAKPMEDEPQMFSEAGNYPDPESQRRWQDAILKELSSLKKQCGIIILES